MRRTYLIVLVGCIFLICCGEKKKNFEYHQPDWNSRKITKAKIDSLVQAKTYLPVYAQIYSMTEENLVDLAATISIRNTDTRDSVFINKIQYYNTNGSLIREYLPAPIFVKPAETLEIVIKSADNEGGSGANFVFEWYSKKGTAKPLFEAVMISTAGQQGISFTSRGVDLN